MYPIRIYGDEILRQIAEPVIEFDSNLEKLVYSMNKSMRKEKGIGLAAPQIGISKRVILVDVSKYTGDPALVIVNPVITNSSEEVIAFPEGCLSIPGFTYMVNRAKHITVEGFTTKGRPIKLNAEGLFAVAIQHEIDHLNGILFTDYVEEEGLLEKLKDAFIQE